MPERTIFDKYPESQARALKVLEKLGYTVVSPGEADRKRGSCNAVLFTGELQSFLRKQTCLFDGEKRCFSDSSIAEAIRALGQYGDAGPCAAGREIYELLCSGKSLEEKMPDGTRRSFDMKYIDFEYPKNNIFQATADFTVERPGGGSVRPDIVVLVNGIPLAVIECMRPGADIREGVARNIRSWGEDYIPQLFRYVQMVVAAAPDNALYGTYGTPPEQFSRWREDTDSVEWLDGWCRKCSPDGGIKEQDRALTALLHPERLLELIQNFIIYDNNIRKICRSNQYFAVKKSMDRILLRDGANTRNGMIWHAYGTGKTLSMLMLAKKIICESMKTDSPVSRPRFIMVTDHINFDRQILDNFVQNQMTPRRAKTGRGLIELLQNDGNTVITARMGKFETALKQGYCNDSGNLFIFLDEGHNMQYGKLCIHMNRVFPNAVKIAFTGMPLLQKQPEYGTQEIVPAKDVYADFGPLIDRYTFQNAINDNITVPVVYENRAAPQEAAGREIMIAFDLHEHFLNHVKPKGFKAMLACSSRAEAVRLFYRIKELGGISPAVVITPSSSKSSKSPKEDNDLKVIADFFKQEVDPFYKNNYNAYEEFAAGEFISQEGNIDLLIVKDRLLTGLNAPAAAVLYADRKLRDHTLLQAIARVNRVYKNKEFGQIIDYSGIFGKLDSAPDFYGDEQSGMNLFDSKDIRGVISALK